MTTNPPSATSDGLAAELSSLGEAYRLALGWDTDTKARALGHWAYSNLPTILAALSPPSAPGDVGLVERLQRKAYHREMWVEPHGTMDVRCDHDDEGAEAYFVNPDGPAAVAALSASVAEVEALRGLVAGARKVVQPFAAIARAGTPSPLFDPVMAEPCLRAREWLALTSPDGGRNG